MLDVYMYEASIFHHALSFLHAKIQQLARQPDKTDKSRFDFIPQDPDPPTFGLHWALFTTLSLTYLSFLTE